MERKNVCNRLMVFLEKYNILYEHQYGFRANHSTIHPMLHLLTDISVANEKNYERPYIDCFSGPFKGIWCNRPWHWLYTTYGYTLIQSHLTCDVQAWSNGNTVITLQTLQKRALRIINNEWYISHTDPLFKSEIYLKSLIYTSCMSYYLCLITTIKHCLNPSNIIYQQII